MREELGAERVRREQAEQERDKLAAELEALREAREGPETVSEEPYSAHSTHCAPSTPQDPAERPSWWRRFFGYE